MALIESDSIGQLRRWKTVCGTFLTPNNDEIVNREIMSTGAWQLGLVQYLQGRCFPEGEGGTFIDAGAHVGMISIPIAKAHPSVAVHAFEPSPLNAVLLTENVCLNNVSNVRVHGVALSDAQGEIGLALSKGNSVDNRMLVGQEHLRGKYEEDERVSINVRRTTLDAALEGMVLPRPIVVKLDVQGHELAVIRGMKSVRPDVLIIEYWPYGLARAGETQAAALAALEEYTHGAPLLGVDTIVRPGLHLELVQALPWGSVNAFELICARL